MTFNEQLAQTISKKNSLLCVGLDPDLSKVPSSISAESEPLFYFCREIIEATKSVAAAFKVNFAFFEAEGSKGWAQLEHVMDAMPSGVITIADAKRADIGNTSMKYAEAILQHLDFDAVTVNPYMGEDSIAPFLQWPEKGAFVLGLTSNPGSADFQQLTIESQPLFKKVAQQAVKWNKKSNVGLVVGATHTLDLSAARNIATDLPFLIPGVGAQGGSLERAIQYGTDQNAGRAIINASRSIIYKSSADDFAEAAACEATALRDMINQARNKKSR